MLIESAARFALLIAAAGSGEGFGLASRSFNRCGPIALQVCAHFVGSEVPGEKMSNLLKCDDEDGCSLAAIEQAASAAGLYVAAVKWNADFPAVTDSPAVIRIVPPNHRGHFVAAVGTRGDRVLLVDVPRKPRWVTNKDLRDRLGWDGYAVHVAKNSHSLHEVRCVVRTRWHVESFVAAACFIVVGLACLAVCAKRGLPQAISAPPDNARME